MAAACGGDGTTKGPPPASAVETSISASTPTPALDTTPEHSTAVLAINANGLEEFPAAVFWIGTSGQAPVLPSGYWNLVIRDAGGVRRTLHAVQASGTDPVLLEQATDTPPGDPGEADAAFTTLSTYIATYHESFVFSLNVLSGGFTTAPFAPGAVADGDSAKQLRLATGELDASTDRAATAAEVLGRQRFASRVPGPSAGIFDFLKDKIKDPIKAQESATRARRDLELAFGRMTIQQQQEAFRQLKDARGLAVDAPDAATFVEQLAAGDYDNEAAQARNFLQNHEDYFEFFDLRNIQTAREEGAKLVSEGAQFYAQALKEVLVKQFPGLEQGWDAVTKLEEKLQRLQHPEIKPEDVQALMKELGYEISIDEARGIVQLADYSYQLLRSKANGPAARPTAEAATIEGGWAVYDLAPIENVRNGKLGLLVAEVDKVSSIKMCSLDGGGLCQGANAASTIGDAGGATRVLGPFQTRGEAVKAFCDNIVPGSIYNSTFWGLMAKMQYDGQLHGIFNAPSCN